MKIKDANIQTLIGVETNASNGETYYVLTMMITAKKINPDDYKDMKGKKDIAIVV